MIPQVTAAWWKQDAVKTPSNVWYGLAIDDSGVDSVAWYGGSSKSGSKITVTPAFG